MCSEEDKEKLDELFEKYKPYLSKPGEGASLFDDWNELAPDFLDQCTVPDRKVNEEVTSVRVPAGRHPRNRG